MWFYYTSHIIVYLTYHVLVSLTALVTLRVPQGNSLFLLTSNSRSTVRMSTWQVWRQCCRETRNHFSGASPLTSNNRLLVITNKRKTVISLWLWKIWRWPSGGVRRDDRTYRSCPITLSFITTKCSLYYWHCLVGLYTLQKGMHALININNYAWLHEIHFEVSYKPLNTCHYAIIKSIW